MYYVDKRKKVAAWKSLQSHHEMYVDRLRPHGAVKPGLRTMAGGEPSMITCFSNTLWLASASGSNGKNGGVHHERERHNWAFKEGPGHLFYL